MKEGNQLTGSMGKLEFAIMNFAWGCGKPTTVPEVHTHLCRSRKLAYTSVMTVMSRLHEKGLLARKEGYGPYTYWPATTREDYSAALMIKTLDELGNREATLARFVERIGPKDAEILTGLANKLRVAGEQ